MIDDGEFKIFIDRTIDFFNSLHEVPTWRFTIAFFLLGKDVTLKLKKLRG